ncbi:transglycosylase SLT domain-containing protein [Sutterella sp.]|uniref:transglycosylase SLT domain-containing protein n=1 Tax=Sutterella sp. TaxID=1981025 RepID=UPI003FD706B8
MQHDAHSTTPLVHRLTPEPVRDASSRLGCFWPTGFAALWAVAAAFWLHLEGFTAAPDAFANTPGVVESSEAVAAAVEAEEEKAAELVSAWEKNHPQGGETLDPIGASGGQVAEYIARSYRISREDARQYTAWAVEIGQGFDVDPLLILAVAATESSFDPKAKSGAGAEGLMQVMTRVHTDKFKAFGGEKAALEPYPNMVVGTSILSRLIVRTGSVAKALKWYYGAANDKTDGGYAAKVFKERSRMLVAAGGDASAAVQLSRRSRTGPDYSAAQGRVKTLAFSEWAALAEALETRLSTAGAVVRLDAPGKTAPAASMKTTEVADVKRAAAPGLTEVLFE